MSSFSKHKKEEAHKAILQKACKPIKDGIYNGYQEAALAFKIPVSTLQQHYLMKTQPHKEAHEEQQLLNSAAEKVLVDWLRYLGLTGHALSKCTIAQRYLTTVASIPPRDGS